MTARAEDCQCKRCGSSVSWESCEQCSGFGLTHHDCGEDTCSCADPEDNIVCDVCDGEGGYGCCLSSPEWCEANPRPGQEQTPRSTVEWFCWHGVLAGGKCVQCYEEAASP